MVASLGGRNDRTGSGGSTVRRIPLRWKIVALTAGTSAALAILLLSFLYLFVSNRMLFSARENARVRLQTVVDLVRPELLTYNTSSIQTLLERQQPTEDLLWLAVFDADGRILDARTYGSGGSMAEIEEAWSNERAERAGVYETRLSRGEGSVRGWIYDIPVRPPGEGTVWGHVYAAVSMAPVLRTIALFRWIIIICTFAVIVIGWGFGSVLSRRITRPIRDLVDHTRVVAAGDLERRLERGSSDEIGTLFRAFDRMQAALAESRDEIRSINLNLEERVRERTERLRETTAYLDRIIRQSHVALVIADGGCRIRRLSKGAEQILGMTEERAVSGLTIHDLFPSRSAAEAHFKRLRSGEVTVEEAQVELLGARGERIPADISLAALTDSEGIDSGYLMVFRDRTREEQERKEREVLEHQLRQLQRLESIGTLAGGIAHDFNNLLEVVLGYADLLLQDQNLDEKQRTRVERIRLSALRGSEVTEQLLGFARKGKITIAPVDLNDVVEEVASLLEHTFDPDIVIVLERAEPAPIVEGDAAQLRQALMNLMLNAKDALLPGGGRIVVRTERVDPDPRVAALMKSGSDGAVLLTVSDNGHGMDPEVLDRVFEPFFTTKPAALGSGLGLSMVYGIVKNHDGAVFVDSDAGEGTSVRIYLPLLKGAADAKRSKPAEGRISPERRLVVLLVDDKEELLALFAEGLREAGFHCLKATSGEEAIRRFEESPEPVDVVVLDLVMPDMDGEDVYHLLRARAPDLPVIIASGYADDQKARALVEAGVSVYLRKPFSIGTLIDQIVKVSG